MSYEILMLILRIRINYSFTLSSFQRTKSFERKFSQNQVKIVYSFSLNAFHELNHANLGAFLRFFLFYKILHRKEVIHPHVLVGIPCYDFTPVTCPTLDGPIPYGLSYQLQVLQTPMA